MAFLILARLIKQTFAINDVVNGSRYWIFTADREFYGGFWRILLTWLDSEANSIFFPSPSKGIDFLPVVKQFLCIMLVHVGDSCLHVLLWASMIAKGSNSVSFHSWIAWNEFCQRDVTVSSSAVVFKCLLRIPICVSCQGKTSLLYVQIKIPAFQLRLKKLFLTVESRVSKDSRHNTFSLFVFFSYCIILFFWSSCCHAR